MGAETPKRSITTANNLQVVPCANSFTGTPTGAPFRKEKGTVVLISNIIDWRNGKRQALFSCDTINATCQPGGSPRSLAVAKRPRPSREFLPRGLRIWLAGRLSGKHLQV